MLLNQTYKTYIFEFLFIYFFESITIPTANSYAKVGYAITHEFVLFYESTIITEHIFTIAKYYWTHLHHSKILLNTFTP